MIFYEVTLTPEAHLRDSLETYMRERHIRDVLSSGCFVSARFMAAASGPYRTTYIAAQQADLDRYLAEHAARTRGDFLAHFPDGVAITREVWTTIEEWQR